MNFFSVLSLLSLNFNTDRKEDFQFFHSTLPMLIHRHWSSSALYICLLSVCLLVWPIVDAIVDVDTPIRGHPCESNYFNNKKIIHFIFSIFFTAIDLQFSMTIFLFEEPIFVLLYPVMENVIHCMLFTMFSYTFLSARTCGYERKKHVSLVQQHLKPRTEVEFATRKNAQQLHSPFSIHILKFNK